MRMTDCFLQSTHYFFQSHPTNISPVHCTNNSSCMYLTRLMGCTVISAIEQTVIIYNIAGNQNHCPKQTLLQDKFCILWLKVSHTLIQLWYFRLHELLRE